MQSAIHSFLALALSSKGLLMESAALLLISAFLLFFSRRQKIAFQRSLVTDEMMLHLSRIAEALERQAARPIQPVHQVIADVPRQADVPVQQQKPSTETRAVAYSMFGR
jgi:hypothetical protein